MFISVVTLRGRTTWNKTFMRGLMELSGKSAVDAGQVLATFGAKSINLVFAAESGVINLLPTATYNCRLLIPPPFDASFRVLEVALLSYPNESVWE